MGRDEIDNYEYGIILPYHVASEMASRYKDKKIKLIVPIPKVKVLDEKGIARAL